MSKKKATHARKSRTRRLTAPPGRGRHYREMLDLQMALAKANIAMNSEAGESEFRQR